jgi:hypothetical protein
VVAMVWLVVLMSVGKLHHRENFKHCTLMITSLVILIPKVVQIFVRFDIAHLFSCFINLSLEL